MIYKQPFNAPFSSPEQNLITRFDNAMVGLIGKGGTFVQDLTGITQTEQLSALSNVAAACFITPNPAHLVTSALRVPVGAYWWSFNHPPRVSTPLENQIAAEATGKNPDHLRCIRAAMLIGGVYSLAIGITHLVNDDAGFWLRALSALPYGVMPAISLINYLSLASFPTPPRKTLPRRLLEAVQERLDGLLNPAPVPIPVRA